MFLEPLLAGCSGNCTVKTSIVDMKVHVSMGLNLALPNKAEAESTDDNTLTTGPLGSRLQHQFHLGIPVNSPRTTRGARTRDSRTVLHVSSERHVELRGDK